MLPEEDKKVRETEHPKAQAVRQALTTQLLSMKSGPTRCRDRKSMLSAAARKGLQPIFHHDLMITLDNIDERRQAYEAQGMSRNVAWKWATLQNKYDIACDWGHKQEFIFQHLVLSYCFMR